MTEREKMQQGLLYDANYDAELLAERTRCKDLCFAYNQLQPSLGAQQEEIIRRLLGKTGERFCITAPFWCDYGWNIESAKISTPTTTASFWTAPKSPSATMYSLPPTAPSPRRGIRWIPNSGTRDWSMPTPSLWATTYGSEPR